ncbi:MAG: MarR family transcriptional regulator, partial [Candidatus Omnitrophica bacterium]|nr:MarR family transcriptional regulator [Candidatus Omnitrophota bacterium]
MPENALAEFIYRIDEVMPAVMKGFAKRQVDDLEMYRGKVTMLQIFILSYIDKNGPLKMKDLAHLMFVTTAAATGIIARLVRCGYVHRKYDSNDRRVIYIELTNKGMELARKANNHRRQILMELFGPLSKEARDNYLSVLTYMRDVLLKENGA